MKTVIIKDMILCPVCQSAADVSRIGEYGSYDICYCSACHLKFSNPMAEPEGGFYEKSSIYENRFEYAVMDKGIRAYDWRYHSCLQLCSSQSHNLLLDIGCGDGKFMALADAGGFNVFGIDIDERAVNFAKNIRNLPNVRKSHWKKLPHIEEWSSLNFDIVTLFDVLEHASCPLSLVSIIFKLLKPGGIVFITVPRLDRYPGVFDAEIDSPPHHFTLWTVIALKVLLKKVGFTDIQVFKKPLMAEDILLHIISRAKRLFKKLKIGKGNRYIFPDNPVARNSNNKLLNFIKKAIFYGLIPAVILVNWFLRVLHIGQGHTLLVKARKPYGAGISARDE